VASLPSAAMQNVSHLSVTDNEHIDTAK